MRLSNFSDEQISVLWAVFDTFDNEGDLIDSLGYDGADHNTYENMRNAVEIEYQRRDMDCEDFGYTDDEGDYPDEVLGRGEEVIMHSDDDYD